MKDTLLSAKLISWTLIRVSCFTSLPYSKSTPVLVKDHKEEISLKVEKLNSLSGLSIADFSLEKELELGHDYEIKVPGFGLVSLDVNDASTWEDFDERFAYDGDDLGSNYQKKATRFALWAPLASHCYLKYKDKGGEEWGIAEMKRSPRGVYRLSLSGDHHGASYLYLICNSGVLLPSIDIYAKASLPNLEASVVVDMSRFPLDLAKSSLPVLNSPTEAIIYEGHVRDLTIDSSSDIVRKGTFLGLCEKGRKTKLGHPAGFDYLVSLGFTHLQLLPLYDYATVDELNPSKRYNWGYDPAQYFVPEGSFASLPSDPFSRIRDLKTMVRAFHEAGIRIVMDVVYNHVYGFEDSSFQKTVPNYYFRQRRNGSFASSSGCGDDLASERVMVRKLIIDACAFWIDQYGIDGFRFDLMGIIDVDTINEVYKMAKKKDHSFMMYGEGWNMGGDAKVPLAHMGNYASLPDVSFFNDSFREAAKRFFAGEESAKNEAKVAFSSSSLDFIFPPKFLDARQSINYVECHDNATLFDYLRSKRKDLSEETILQAVLGCNAFVALSLGIPFFHAGQEIASSKWGEDNTYNKGDRFNKFSYSLLDERYEMATKFKELLALRKKIATLLAYDPTYIDWNIDISETGPLLKIIFLDRDRRECQKKTTLYFSCSSLPYNLGKQDGKTVYTSALSGCQEDEALVPALSFCLIEDR